MGDVREHVEFSAFVGISYAELKGSVCALLREDTHEGETRGVCAWECE